MNENTIRNNKLAKKEGYIAIIINIVLFALKYWAGIVSGSIALISDAWHSLSDSISSLAIIIGVKISEKPADEEHPFGHGRAELITSIVVAMFLVIIAFDFLLESIDKFGSGENPKFGILAISVLVFSLIAKELSAQYAFYLARKTGNLALRADGWHHRSDSLSTVLVLIGIFVSKYVQNIDSILGILVSIMILYSAYLIMKESANAIMGTATKNETIETLKKISNETAGFDTEVHHFHTHKYGPHEEVTFHIRLPKDFSVEKAYGIIRKIKKQIKEETYIHATININPK